MALTRVEVESGAAVRASAHVAARPPLLSAPLLSAPAPSGLVNMALADAPTTVRARKNTQRTRLKRNPGPKEALKGAKPPAYNCARTGIRQSQVRLGQKNVPRSPSLSADPIGEGGGGSRGSASTYRVRTDGVSVQEAAPSMALSLFTLSSPPPAHLVVLLS